MFQSNKKRTPTTNNGGNKMRNTLYDQARKEGKSEGRNEGKNEMKNEITNEITTLIQKGKLPQDTLNQIHSLKM